MIDLRRDREASLTQQLVGHISERIDAGELRAGEKLPATRALAELAGINHLTAVRVYRRLAELGYVTAAVGRGTFVRQRLPVAPAAAPAGAAQSHDWQLGMLAQRSMSYAGEMLRDSLHAPLTDGVIPLASGFPDPRLCPSAELAAIAAEVAAEQPEDVTGYMQVEGLAELRDHLAGYGREVGYASSAGEILITNGARQGIDLVARAVLGPGDVAAIESPTFAGLLASLQATGARVLPLCVDDGGIDVDQLGRHLARHEIKLVALQPSCQNPTGADLAPDRRARLLELARTRGFFVLEDGVYATMRYDGPPLRRMRADAPSHVIYVDSLSKSIGGGLRVGWIAAAGPVRSRLLQLKLDSDIHTASLPQLLAARYMRRDRHDRLLAESLPVYRRRRDSLVRALDRHLGDDATWRVPGGGHHVWVTLNEPLDERELYSEAYRAGVTFLPGGAIQAESTTRTSMRLSFGLAEPELHDEAIRRLAAALREVRRRGRGSATGALS